MASLAAMPLVAANGTTTSPVLTSEISAQLMTITPQMAAAWLRNRPANRPVSKARVRAMIEDMRAGRWATNGESLILDAEQRVLDGQHRLMAVQESGVAITALVAVGVAQTALASIDQGVKRSGADVLAMSQMEQPQALASAARWLWRYLHARMRSSGIALRAPELAAFVQAHPGLATSLSWGRSVRAVLPQSCATTLHYVMAQKEPALAKQVFHALATGLGMEASDPVYITRERLLKDKDPLRHAGIVQRAAAIVLAWNARRAGKTSVGLWKGIQDATAVFPTVL